MPAYTHYWANEMLGYLDLSNDSLHTAGSQFTRRGVTTGDRVYMVTILHGSAYLVSAFTVAEPPVGYKEAQRRLDYEVYEAPEHLFGIPGSGVDTRIDRVVPREIERKLRFHSPKGEIALTYLKDGTLDRQTLRGVRQLTAASARILDDFLEISTDNTPPPAVDFYAFMRMVSEGVPAKIPVVVRQRCAALRAVAREHYRGTDGLLRCAVCGWHRPREGIARDIVELHHVDVLKEAPKQGRQMTLAEAIQRLTPLCPNCHRLIHAGSDGVVFTVEALRTLLKSPVLDA